jgi:glycosyltransferase involved in cell wall biosynthesis
MRIALDAQKLSVTQGYQAGGISRYIYHLLRELRRAPSAHSFLAFLPRAPSDDSLASTQRFRLNTTGRSTERPSLRVAWEQLMLPGRLLGRCDLLHGLAFALPLAWPGKSVVTIFDLSFRRYPKHFNRGNRLYLTLATGLAVRRADRVLTISKHGRQEVVELFGVSPARVSTTYCAADERFHPLPPGEVQTFRRARGLPERFILYLGTLEPRKNVVTLLLAYSRLRADWRPAPKLVLAGARGWLFEDVFKTIDQLGLTEHVLLPGFVPADEQALWYNAAAVFAYPSLYEGFGLPPLEAMACGTPVVVSNATSLPEVVGQAGLLVHPTDDGALALALRQALEDDRLASDLRRAGLEQAAQFSWRRMALETLRCYEEVASEA